MSINKKQRDELRLRQARWIAETGAPADSTHWPFDASDIVMPLLNALDAAEAKLGRVEVALCYNCNGSGQAVLWDSSKPDSEHDHTLRPCVVCDGTGYRLEVMTG